MINIFGWMIVRTEEVERLKNLEANPIIFDAQPTLHCGYKSCQFSTTDERGLKIHRARIHRHK